MLTAHNKESGVISMHDIEGQTVMVVEDSTTQREHLVALMQELRFGTVLQAGEGAEALRLLDQYAPHEVYLVITDVDMPGMDGIELVSRLAELPHVQHMIVMSARDPRLLETVESVAQLSARGGQLLGTVPKPVTREALLRMLLDSSGPTPGGPPKAEAMMPMRLDEIESGLAAGHLVPFVQPKVDIGTGVLKGVEALARWRHPERGLLGPQCFIPVVEGTPLMARFTLTMAEQSLQWLGTWLRALPSLTISINLSADDLADAAFIERLTALVKAHQIEPRSVCWEVTETMILASHSLGNLARLGLKGFGLAMDDYGIGYSSMQTLSRSPFTELKIDRIFVNGAAERANRRAILVSSLDMGKHLGITTVAEGVETEADWRLLRELGCDVAQGYLVARPMPAGELVPWTRSNRARLRALASS